MLHYLSGPQVTVTVGGKKFDLPKLLLCDYSKYFDKAFNGNFQEGEKQAVELDNVSIDAFDMVIR